MVIYQALKCPSVINIFRQSTAETKLGTVAVERIKKGLDSVDI